MIMSLRFKSILALGIALLVSINTHANEDDEAPLDARYENWFQIELIIFDQISSGSSTSPESWPNNIELIYPTELDFLFSEAEWTAFTAPVLTESDEQSMQAESKLDDDNLSLGDEIGKTDLDAKHTQNTSSRETNPSHPFPKVNDSDLPTSASTLLAEPDQTVLPEMQIPRIKLAEQEHTLTSERRRLTIRPDFRVLFHEAWRQEIKGEDATDILITGGDSVEENFELEGTIKLSLRRFLHLETNLWRNSFVPNYGQEIPYWPALPPLPKPVKPEPEFASVGENHRFSNTISSDQDNLSSNSPFTGARTNSSFNLGTRFGNGSSQLETNKVDESGFNFNTTLENNDAVMLDEAFNIKKANLVSEIITLRQKRRMRSSELHYIDHPRLGLVIKITPYEVNLPERKDSLIEAFDGVAEN